MGDGSGDTSRVAKRGLDDDGLPSAAFRPALESSVRIMTWNVWGRVGPWEERLRSILDTIERQRPDVVTLQESWKDVTSGRRLDEIIAEEFGWQSIYRPYGKAGGTEIGLAVLTRWDLGRTSSLDLPTPEGAEWGRRVLMAEVEGPRGGLRLFTTHLSYGLDRSLLRQSQVAALAAFVSSEPSPHFPPIVTGDLNAEPDSDEIRSLTGLSAVPVPGFVLCDSWVSAGRGPGVTWSNENQWAQLSRERDRRIDYILVGLPYRNAAGFVVSAEVVGRPPAGSVAGSDHYAVVADLLY